MGGSPVRTAPRQIAKSLQTGLSTSMTLGLMLGVVQALGQVELLPSPLSVADLLPRPGTG